MPDRLFNIVLGLLVVLVVAMIAAGIGYQFGHRAAKQASDLELATYRGGLAQTTANNLAASLQKFGQRVAFGNLLTSQLVDQERQHAQTAATLHATVPHVTTTQPRPADDAPCVFTRGWLRVYNAAIGASAAVPDATQGASLPAEASDASATAAGDDATCANVSPADVLNHVIDYGQRTKDLGAQLNHLIDFEDGADVQ
ncbi:hypothetical protein ACQVRX_11300 [Ralstonia pseudosolanacearum]